MTTKDSLSSSEPQSSTLEALEILFQRFIELSHKLDQSLPKVEHDENWCSECIINGTPDDNGLIQWKPTRRKLDNIFSHMENALGVKFHPDIISYYGLYWSDGIVVSHESGEMSLIQIWNAKDEEMLKENLLGHAFAKQKNRLPLTLFIGCTYNDEIISIDNDSGHVVLEKAGFASHETLANSVGEFLTALTPTLKPYNE